MDSLIHNKRSVAGSDRSRKGKLLTFASFSLRSLSMRIIGYGRTRVSTSHVYTLRFTGLRWRLTQHHLLSNAHVHTSVGPLQRRCPPVAHGMRRKGVGALQQL